jgi:hypothetical protein
MERRLDPGEVARVTGIGIPADQQGLNEVGGSAHPAERGQARHGLAPRLV